MTLSVTVLGSSAMFATTERACSGYLLRFDGLSVWMDAGAGSWRNLLQIVDYPSLDAIVLSHRHPDHTTDVFQAFHARQYGGPEPLDRVPLWAPQETLDRLCNFGAEIDGSFDMRAIAAGDRMELGSARLSFVSMAHPPETVGVRLEHDGAVIAYSSDTGPSADITSLARDADLFICEATLQDSDESWEGHMKASQAGKAAGEAGARRLLLTHLPPHRDLDATLAQARSACGSIPVELAADGRTWEVGG